MNKRIVCVLLTLIMLLSLVPMGASAATNKTSDAAITVLKQMTNFKEECYHFTGSEFRIGYGTVCEKTHHFNAAGKPDQTKNNEHTITKANADIALSKALLALDEKVNAFASQNGLSLKQNQHDALVVFSHDAGTDWMNGNGILKSVLIKGCDATELLNAMAQWTYSADMSRRQVEVNMYMNGIYSNAVPSNYSYVIYDPNGGSMPQQDYDRLNKQYTKYFDANKTMEHPVVPTKAGSVFLGWYTNADSAPSWAPSLTGSLKGKTLTALWQTGTDLKNSPVSVSYNLKKAQLAELLVYGNDNKVNTTLTEKLIKDLDADGVVAVEKDYIDGAGIRWSLLKGYTNGWVMVGTPKAGTVTDSNGTVIATATVTVNGYLNLRQEAGTDSRIIGALAKNDTVDLYEIKTVNGHQWGRSKYGWLCLTYTRVIMKTTETISDAGALAYTFTGKVTNGPQKVHVEAGSDTNFAHYDEADGNRLELSIAKNKAITLTNLVVVNNSELWAKATWKNDEWKYTDDKKGTEKIQVSRSGWINMDNVDLDPVKYVVVANSVNVRECRYNASGEFLFKGDAEKLVFTLNKGVEVKIDAIALINENLWGHFIVKDQEQTGHDYKEGWVNLASKYMSRTDAPAPEQDSTITDKVGTVINTDSLKVRKTGATYAAQVATLSRGTTVKVWEADEDGWYKVDSNKNGVYDYETDGWVFGKYLEITSAKAENTTVTDQNGNKYETDGTGKGIVANTYSGVNVRTGAGTAYATNGKLLPGTVVEILETANGGKWGRVAQGWISMDYVTMITYNEADTTPEGGTTVESYDKADKTTTTAVYTGTLAGGVKVYRNPEVNDDELIRMSSDKENVTIYELAAVTKTVNSDTEKSNDPDLELEDQTTVTTVTTTTYWARINEGWIQNPARYLSLDPLDEKVHTQTGVDKLNVRKGYDEWNANEGGAVFDILVKGDQVKVTALDIIKDKVWGRVETNEGTGWIRLDYMSEGAVYVQAPVQNNPTTAPSAPVLGNTSSTGGFVNNTTGYRYTGKIIRANEVNVRATPSTTAAKTTALKNGAALVIYETTVAENMAWGRCDAGWVYLYYVDLTPVVNGAVDARVVYNDNTIIYTDVNCSAVAGTYARMSVVDIYEIVGKMARTDLGWINTDDLL